MSTLFKAENGQTSMRRVLAFIATITGVVAGLLSIVLSGENWQVILVSFGIPFLAAIILLTLTTAGDIAKVTAAVKSGVSGDAQQKLEN